MRLLPFIAAFLLLIGCNNQANTSSTGTNDTTTAAPSSAAIHEVLSVNDFQQKIKGLDGILLDVRTPEELLETGKIESAISIDYNGADFQQKIAALNKEKPIMVYCKSGGRSGKTAVILKKEGFKEIYDLDGGIQAWKAANLPLSQFK